MHAASPCLDARRPSWLRGCRPSWLRGCRPSWLRGCRPSWLRGCRPGRPSCYPAGTEHPAGLVLHNTRAVTSRAVTRDATLQAATPREPSAAESATRYPRRDPHASSPVRHHSVKPPLVMTPPTSAPLVMTPPASAPLVITLPASAPRHSSRPSVHAATSGQQLQRRRRQRALKGE
jgi:hypothetical protein